MQSQTLEISSSPIQRAEINTAASSAGGVWGKGTLIQYWRNWKLVVAWVSVENPQKLNINLPCGRGIAVLGAHPLKDTHPALDTAQPCLLFLSSQELENGRNLNVLQLTEKYGTHVPIQM